MNNKNKWTLENEAFDEMKKQLDGVIRRSFDTMIAKGADEAKIMLGIGLELQRGSVLRDGAFETRMFPKADFKICLKISNKYESEGKIADGQMMLFDDGEGGFYLADDEEQLSVYDDETV